MQQAPVRLTATTILREGHLYKKRDEKQLLKLVHLYKY